jgi:hypothetical protein
MWALRMYIYCLVLEIIIVIIIEDIYCYRSFNKPRRE